MPFSALLNSIFDPTVPPGDRLGVYGAERAHKKHLLSQFSTFHFSLLPDPVAYCPWVSVYDNLKFAQRIHEPHDAHKVNHVLELFDLQKLKSKLPYSLTGLAVKRLGLAMMQIQAPDLYILENPTSGLDKADALRLSALVKDTFLKPVLLFTNRFEEIERLCTRFSVVQNNRVVCLVKNEDALTKSPSIQEFIEGLS